MPCISHALCLVQLLLEKKNQTKQNKDLCNRTASAIHTNVPCFPGARFASKWYSPLDIISIVRNFLGLVLVSSCQYALVASGLPFFCLKFIFLNKSICILLSIYVKWFVRLHGADHNIVQGCYQVFMMLGYKVIHTLIRASDSPFVFVESMASAAYFAEHWAHLKMHA